MMYWYQTHLKNSLTSAEMQWMSWSIQSSLARSEGARSVSKRTLLKIHVIVKTKSASVYKAYAIKSHLVLDSESPFIVWWYPQWLLAVCTHRFLFWLYPRHSNAAREGANFHFLLAVNSEVGSDSNVRSLKKSLSIPWMLGENENESFSGSQSDRETVVGRRRKTRFVSMIFHT